MSKANNVPSLGEDLDKDRILSMFREDLSNSKAWFDPIREKSKQLYALYFGDKEEFLEKDDRRYMQSIRRFYASIPLAKGRIDAVVGADMSDRKEAVFRGTSFDDVDQVVAEWQTELNRQEMNSTNSWRTQTQVLQDLLVTGYGFAEVFIDLSRNPMRIPERAVQWWEMHPDPDAVEPCLEDARFWLREAGWHLEQAQSQWKDHKEDLESMVNARGSGGKSLNLAAKARGTGGSAPTSVSGGKHGKVEIFDYVYKRYVPQIIWVDPLTGEEQDTKEAEYEAAVKAQEDEFEALVEQFSLANQAYGLSLQDPEVIASGVVPEAPQAPEPPEPIEVVSRYTTERWYRCHIAGGINGKAEILLDGPTELPLKSGPPYKCATGFGFKDFDERRVRFFGLMHLLWDVQLYFNKAMAIHIETLGRQSKGGGFVERSAIIGNKDKFVKDQAIVGHWSVMEDGSVSGNAIREKQVGQGHTGMERLMQTLSALFPQASGVSDAMSGQLKSERSNVLISNLQSQGYIALQPILDQMTTYRTSVARCRAEIIRAHYSPEQINRTLGEQDPEAMIGVLYESADFDPAQGMIVPKPITNPETGMPLTPGDVIKAIDPLSYDITVDVGQASPTTKQLVWQIFEQGNLQALIEALQQAGLDTTAFATYVMECLPIPGTKTRALIDDIEKQKRQKKMMAAPQGIVQAAIEQGAEGAQSIIEQITQALQAQQPKGQEQPQPPAGAN